MGAVLVFEGPQTLQEVPPKSASSYSGTPDVVLDWRCWRREIVASKERFKFPCGSVVYAKHVVGVQGIGECECKELPERDVIDL